MLQVAARSWKGLVFVTVANRRWPSVKQRFAALEDESTGGSVRRNVAWKAFAGVAVMAVATVCATGSGNAQQEEPLKRSAVARQSVSVQAAAAQVDDLWRSKAQWAGEYADDIASIHPDHGQLTVLVKDHVDEIHDRVPAALRPYVSVARGGVALAAGSPSSDRGGWTAGNHLYSINALNQVATCTAGFAWKSWATGAVLGSTALHCYQGANPWIEWYHENRHFGTRTQAGTAENNDVLLLRPAPNTSFSATAWVYRSGIGYVERTVTTATPNKLGDTVAFYGRTSLGGGGTIGSTAHNGKTGWIWADADQVRPGDSGGPVYRTTASGTVDARGTVHGFTYFDANRNGQYDRGEIVDGLIFVDAAYTSADLRASIYTG